MAAFLTQAEFRNPSAQNLSHNLRILCAVEATTRAQIQGLKKEE